MTRLADGALSKLHATDTLATAVGAFCSNFFDIAWR